MSHPATAPIGGDAAFEAAVKNIITVHRGMGIQVQLESTLCHKVNKNITCKGVDKLAR